MREVFYFLVAASTLVVLLSLTDYQLRNRVDYITGKVVEYVPNISTMNVVIL